MPQALFIRAPFAYVAGSDRAHYTITENFEVTGRTLVQVDGSNPARLTLQPVFPGKLTFKPDATAVVPQNPSTDAATILGNLYLELSAQGVTELRVDAPTLGYPLCIAYLNVTVNAAFFTGAVLKALLKSNGTYKTVKVGNVTLSTAAQLSNGFALGQFSVDIEPKEASAVYTFPTIQLPTGATVGSIELVLGVRTTVGPIVQPARLKDVGAAEVLTAPPFAPIPLAFFYRFLRHTARWTTLAATDHEAHKFYEALDALENAAPLGCWRRLRVFPTYPVGTITARPDRVSPIATYDAVDASATDAAGTNLWTSGLSRLGEVYRQRVDGEGFRLTAMNGGAPVQVALQPTDQKTPHLDLQWVAPAANQEPPGIDITADFPAIPDPLAAGVDLEFGAYDSGGRTYDKDKNEIAQQELVGPLQALLRGFGFGGAPRLYQQGSVWHTMLSTQFDHETRSAVREFQRDSLTTVRDVAGVTQNVAVTFAGAINGRLDAATRSEMDVWRTNSYRSPVRFYIQQGTNAASRIDDIGFPDASSFGWRLFLWDGTELGKIWQYGSMYGLANPYVEGDAVVRRGRLLVTELNDAATQANYAGARWEKRVILEVVHNESRVFEAINQYDDAFLSCGLFQWTSGTDNKPFGELPGVCSTLSGPDFNRLLGVYGLGATDLTGQIDVSVLRGRWTFDGQTITPDLKKELRAFRWAHRFVAASADNAFRQMQWRHARSRLNIVLGVALNWGATATTGAQLLQSEFLRAVGTDHCVNRPDDVKPPGADVSMLQEVIGALRDPGNVLPTWNDQANPVTNRIRLNREARRLHGKNATHTDLTPTEHTALRQTMTNELDALVQQCQNANTAQIVCDADGTLHAQAQADLTQAQVDAVAVVYKWRRENTRNMYDPDGRWASVNTGGHTGALGNLDRAPRQYAP